MSFRTAFAAAAAVVSGCGGEAPPTPAPPPPPPRSEEPPAPSPSPEDVWMDAALKAVGALSEDDLLYVAEGRRDLVVPGFPDACRYAGGFERASAADLGITEAIRRGGEVRAAWFSEGAAKGLVEPLTAVRRIQGKPDPMEVLVENPGPLTVEWPALPPVTVVLRIAEGEVPPLRLEADYYSRPGFLSAFRIDVRDDRGRTLPNRRWYSREIGPFRTGRLISPLIPWRVTLDPRVYVPIPDPGSWELRAQYAEDSMFSGTRDPRGRLFWSSKPVALTVTKRRIEVTRADRAAARSAISSLSKDGPFRFVDGARVEDCPDFIAPDSPEGRILLAGWKAVPALLDALEAPELGPRQRAWLLALLYSISGVHDPRYSGDEVHDASTDGVFSGGWMFNSWEAAIGGRTPRVVKGDCGKLDLENQKRFAARWKRARAFLEIVEK